MSTPSIPHTQTAILFEKTGGPLILKRDHPVTQPQDLQPGECLVNIKFSGVCHTDLHAMNGDWPLQTKLPLIGGHEGAGIVVAIAEHTETDIKVGDRVGIKFCRLGDEPLCARTKLSGYTVDGTFQQYAVASCRTLTQIPDSLPLELAAPILCAGLTVYKALKNANCKPGDTVLVSGAGGGLGSLCVQYARAIGLRVLAVDTGEAKRALCVDQLGADEWIDFKETENLIEKVKEVCGGLGPHAAIVASSVGAAYEDALEYLRPAGTLVAVGLPADTVIKAGVFWTVAKSLRIVGSYVGNRQDAVEAIDLATRGLVKPTIEIKQLEDLEKVFDDMQQGRMKGRVVLKVSD